MDRPGIRILELSFLLLLAVLTYAFYRVMQPFLLDIFIAVMFAAVLFPLCERLGKRLGNRIVLASILVVLLAFVTVAVPVSIIGVLVYSEAVEAYSALANRLPELTSFLGDISILDWVSRVPLLTNYVGEIDSLALSDLIRDAVSLGSNFIITATQRSFVSVSTALIHFALVLLLMFFLFSGGRKMVVAIYNVLPIPNRELREIAEEMRRTTSATLISTVLIGLIEGSYGAILFLIFGLPSPFLWGLIIMILSMIPVIGTNLVLVPAGIVMAVSGRVFAGIALVILGLAGVAITQNVVKPKLLGDRSGLHPALVLLATIGGIAWLGLVGFLVGPLVASLFLVVWQQFGKRYRSELDSQNAEGDAGKDSDADDRDGRGVKDDSGAEDGSGGEYPTPSP